MMTNTAASAAFGGHPIATILEPADTSIGATVPSVGGASAGRSTYNAEVFKFTSASLVAPTTPQEYLTGLYLLSSAKTGWFDYLFDGVHHAIFPSPSSGVDATGVIGTPNWTFYPMNVGPLGTGLPAASQTYGGGLTAALFVCSNKTNPKGHAWSDFRGVAAQVESSAASSVAQTITIPGTMQTPLGLTSEFSVAATATGVPYATAQWPTIQGWNPWAVPFLQTLSGRRPKVYPVPYLDPVNTFSITNDTYTLGGATDVWLTNFVWY